MIQRIQTIFIFIAALALGIQSFTTILHSSVNDQSGIYVDGNVFMSEYLPAYILLWAAAVSSLIAIFVFKNRKTQKLLVLVSVLLILAGNLTSGLFFFTPTENMMNSLHAEITPGMGAWMPLLSVIALILAYRGINKDDKIVKSMDRLR